MDNKLSELSKPVRIHRDWNRASMCHCGKCDLWKMTIADADGVQTCASCYDAEFLSEWQDYAEAADKRIAELEDAEQKLCAANVTLDARASAAEAKLATPIQIVNYDEFFICHVSGASDDYCKGWVDGRNAAARDVVKAGFTVEDKQ